MIDTSWAMANRGGRFDRKLMIGATLPQYAGWLGGTVIGAVAGSAIGDPSELGLDAMFPAFFLALLVEEREPPGAGGRRRRRRARAGPDAAAASGASDRGRRAGRGGRCAPVTEVWTTIGVLALVGAAIKATGPVLVGGRELPGWTTAIIALLAPALLSALVVVDTFGSERDVVLDARAGGLVVAAVALALRAPLLVVVVAAAAATGGLRALG